MKLAEPPANLMDVNTIDEGVKACAVAETISLHMIEIHDEAGIENFAALVLNNSNFPAGAVALLTVADAVEIREALNQAIVDLCGPKRH